MVDPTGTLPLAPGTESWGQQYGPIGVVAAVAIAMLILWVVKLFGQQKDDKDRQNKAEDDATKRNTALSDKIVEIVTAHQREMLDLVASLTRENEQRYQVLLGRHIDETRANAEALRAMNTATAAALNGVVTKLSKTAE